MGHGCCVLMGRAHLTACSFVCSCSSVLWPNCGEISHKQFGFALSCSSLNEGGKHLTGTLFLHRGSEINKKWLHSGMVEQTAHS